MKVKNYLTHIDNTEDLPFLKTKLFDVNIRLAKSNFQYFTILQECMRLISLCCLTKMDGYKLPHGMSGANVGVPFNIIGIAINRGTIDTYCKLMINPKIFSYEGKEIEVDSNCGSIRLEKPIKIKRFEKIGVEYVTPDLQYRQDYFNRDSGSLTIQHEVDHNLGILITDRV